MEVKVAISTGDVVQLKSGGPKMTVNYYHGEGTYKCSWFTEGDKSNELKEGLFSKEALKKLME